MNNKGQTTILFSLIIGIFLLFTLTALEVGRIHLRSVKIKPCVHSMRSSVMADYNAELFERYHLLFMDPTYGTGSEAVLEEKIVDYLETSLNGEEGSTIYQFQVEEVALAETKTILSNNLQLLKQQIKDYESTAGAVNRIKDLLTDAGRKNTGLDAAAQETASKGKEIDVSGEADEGTTGTDEDSEDVTEDDYTDPRDSLDECLKLGILSFVAPDKNFSKEICRIKHAPSEEYEEVLQEERSREFDDIDFLNSFLDEMTQESALEQLTENAAFASYVTSHFSNGIAKKEGSVMQCEVEYILKGKDNDYDNMEAVAEELTWMRMPMNYAYLLTDPEKKSQALALATTISIATGTGPFVEVIKYLLLACWAYGESLQEVKVLLSGEKIAYIKTKDTWYTDLETLTVVNNVEKQSGGLSYEDFLAILLVKKTGASLDKGYARILDVIQLNLLQDYTTFRIEDCVGSIKIQGKISMNPLFQKSEEEGIYDYYFEEQVLYE